ncbi:hypothetical protein [Treponema sp. C6A8]|uniref:hypothetical protein n=1 Tax=Treponema sp. C6A8 TaxID=1410609 RepID=UPI0004899DBE|nr:hypothetical protein [Treponema sp. C6A8]
MKKVALILAAAAIFTFTSCGSKPAPEETTPEAPVVQEEVTEDSTEEAVVEEVEETNESVKDRDAILAEIEDARKAALEAGAKEYAPQALADIDKIFERVKESEGDISADGAALAARYAALTSYVQAKKEKQKIDDNGYAAYNQKDYDAGLEYLNKVEEALADEDWDTSSVAADADKAYGKFKNVTFAACKKLAMEERDKAFEAKRNADSVKAGVSRKEEYKAAADLFKAGDQQYAIQNPEAAYNNYKSAKEQFNALYQDVSKKRAAAQKKLDEAKKAVEESAELAAEADEKAPILDTEEIEGIEEAGAVLLEEDSYEAPEAAEIEIPAAIDDNGNAVEVEENVEPAPVAEEE